MTLTIDIHLESDYINPREEWDHIAVIACRNDHRRYQLGDADAGFSPGDFDSFAEIRAHLEERGAIPETFVGLALTDHSGLTLHVDVSDGSTCGDKWDTAFIGWGYITAETAGAEGLDPAKLREYVVSECEEYGAYLSGEVYGYTITDDETGEEVDGCGGFFGLGWVRRSAEETKDALEPIIAERNRLTAERREADLAWYNSEVGALSH